MKWPHDWLPERLAAWRPQPVHMAGAAVVLIPILLAALWAAGAFGGSDDDEGELACMPCPASRTPSPRPTRSRAPTASVTPCCTETTAPTPVPTAAPTAAPTARPTDAPAGAGPPSARLAQLLPWNGSDPRTVELAMFPGSTDEALIATQHEAAIWRVSISGAHQPVLFGSLSDRVGPSGNEEGLLTVAFSPDFANDRRVYVYYTRGAPEPTVLSRFQVANGGLDTANETVILEVPDFASNHNGGHIVFGKDGYLYLSTGDGGGGGDPQENGQNTSSLLGKVLRLNVTGQQTYTIPPDNPFAGGGGAPEVWAYGFRNPWRMTVDSATGEIWVGDVGQNSQEEVDRVVPGGNHGWDCFEGTASYEPEGCPGGGFVAPRATYSLAGQECAVTGGYVYRGSAIASLSGWYVYADFCSGKIWAVNPSDNSAPVLLADTDYSISSFAELPGGEIAVLTFDNAIYRLVP